MSTLWTPGGDVPLRRDVGQTDSMPDTDRHGSTQTGSPDRARSGSTSPARPPIGADKATGEGPDHSIDDLSSEERAALAEQVDELRGQLLEAPVEAVVANHAYGLFELAAVHLSEGAPNLERARVAVDAFGAIVEGLRDRLGEAEPSLREALAQIRMAFVQIAQEAAGPPGS